MTNDQFVHIKQNNIPELLSELLYSQTPVLLILNS